MSNLWSHVNEQREQAKRLLVHYFRNVGGVHDSDSVVEIEEIVDHIIEAAIAGATAEMQAKAK